MCPYPFGVAAGQRLKYEQYIDSWSNNGSKITISPFIPMFVWNILYKEAHYFLKTIGLVYGYTRRLIDLFRVWNYDLVYVFMWGTPYGFPVYEIFLKILSKKIIYDLEDNLLINKKKYLNKTKFLILQSNYVIVSSPYLEEEIEKMRGDNNCKYVTSSINTKIFVPRQINNNKRLTIGWTGTFSSKKYLNKLIPILLEIQKTHDFEFKIISNFEMKIPELNNYSIVRWVKEKEVEEMQTLDIGVYPVDDTLWEKGKSGLKAIQYMAFGIPSICDAVGINTHLIENEKNGFLVRNNEEWKVTIIKLLENSELRKAVGSHARNFALNNFSNEVVGKVYKKIIEDVTK